MKRCIIAIIVVAMIGIEPKRVGASQAVLARWVANAIANGVAEDSIKENLIRDFSMAEEFAAILLIEGRALAEQIGDDPNPSDLDCTWSAYQKLNANCADPNPAQTK